LKGWRHLLKQGGYLVVSEITWLRHDLPDEIREFWSAAYPEIGSVTEKISMVEKCGYLPLAHLTLPPFGWEQNYYKLMEAAKQDYLNLYGHVPEAHQIVENEMDLEMKLYAKYKEYYSYVFYIMRKNE
jgi:hypothetical protein